MELPEKYREVIHLFYYEDYSITQISRILHKKESTVRSLLKTQIFQKDAVELSSMLPHLDLVYLDPPYNQHPYGSNYFMLNLILKNKIDVEISRVSGITQDWNRSVFNSAKKALASMEEIIKNLNASFIIISYNSEGFITFE